jgi:1,4-alpha-glucan branching enzyme
MLPIFKDDPHLRAHEHDIMLRIKEYRHWKKELDEKEGGLLHFAEGYQQFGFHRDEANKKWIFREWLPKVKQAFLIGEFNGWSNDNPAVSEGFGRWRVDLPDKPDGTWAVQHKTQVRVRMEGESGNWFDRVPAFAKLAWQDTSTNLFNGVFWEPPSADRYKFKHRRPPKPENLKIYEAHAGFASIHERVATWTEFKDDVLPRIKRLGYNCVQLMAVAEHAHYGSFGYHVTSFYAPTSRCGTPEELKEMIDAAHGHGIIVLMDLVHAHCSSNQIDGVAAQDGTDHCYTHGGAKGKQEQWDSSLFHYTKWEVLRYLLSNVRWWLEEYGFDGFRFDGVTSMLYHSHGIGKGYSGGYHEYFGLDADVEAHTYLMLANNLIHKLLPRTAITVAEDVSGMPTLCRPVAHGGFGFDYRLAMALPDMWIKLLKETPDDDWDMGHITHSLQNRRWKEPCVAYTESHDQAIVGDKTTAFWLMDAEMYTHMSTMSPPSMCVDRGLALHKMLRLVTMGLGGEAWLCFMGNEFGHPEWVDFPRPENGWSYSHCRRRFDLPAEDHLKYKFFEAFDVLMCALENRFRFMASDQQFCSKKDQGDKVIVFERGPLLFVFNFHPCNSYTDYRVGHPWNEGLRVLLDSDEGRFGGHMRLEWGHSNSAPPGEAWDNRYHSTQLYIPSRTVQVLCRDSLLEGGVTIRLAAVEPEVAWPFPKEELRLAVVDEEGKAGAAQKFDAAGSAKFPDASAVSFKIFRATPDGKQVVLPFAPEVFKVYFPGEYMVDANGNMACLGGAGSAMPGPGDAPAPGCTEAPGDPPRKPFVPPARSASDSLLPPSEVEVEALPEANNLPEVISFAKMKAEPPLESLPSSGAQTPSNAKNVPSDMISDTNSEASQTAMHRVFSLSALDCLISGPEDRGELRKGLPEDTSPGYEPRHLDTPVVVVSSEVNPWSKTGGLAMVAGSYGYEFAVRGHRTMVVSPRYGEYKDMEYCGFAKIWLDGREHEVKYFHQRQEYSGGKGADYIFVEHDCYKRPAGLYWDPAAGKEYGDNLFRFALLSLAAMEAPLILNLNGSAYGQDVVFFANDWQAGLVPVYLTYKYRRHNTYKNARCIMMLHNMGYQGKYRVSKFPVDSHLGLPIEAMQELQGEDLNMGDDCINLLAAGIKLADRVLTVSPNYAHEIQTPEGGQGCHDILQAKGNGMRLGGILNGISDEWNPSTDPHISVKFGAADFEAARRKNKADLQKKLGLHEDPDACLLGFCGRLCYQKGVQLITAAIGWMLNDEGNGVTGRNQLVMMGKGDEKYAGWLKDAEAQNKGRVCGYVGFDPRVEHQMMAGCDFLLMPSQYEPCGLPQMYAQQYGTLPIVHETGGLKDSVVGLWDEARDRGKATGFLFAGFDENKFKERLWQALEVYHKKKDVLKEMQMNALHCNYYWPKAIEEYEKHIDWTMEAEATKA